MSNDPEKGWPVPAPMSNARFNEISAMAIKWWQHNRARYDRFNLVTALKAVGISHDEMMEYLEVSDQDEEVVQPPHIAHCTSCDANVTPLDLGGIKVCPQCKLTLEIS